MEDPARRISNLVRMSQPHKLSPDLPLTRLYQNLINIYDQAEAYASENKCERAFSLYLRFVATVTEELPKHMNYNGINADHKNDLCRRTIRAINEAEKMKRELLKLFTLESQDYLATQIDMDEKHKAKPPESPNSVSLRLQIGSKTYTTCDVMSNSSFLFQRIVIPNDLAENFVTHTTDNFKFGLLYGKLLRRVIVATHIITTKTDEASLANMKKIINDPASLSGEVTELILIGCVCSSFEDSAIERFIGASLLNEIVCVMVKPTEKKCSIIHLIKTPDDAASTSQQTSKLTSLSEAATCENLHITPSMSCTMGTS
uniref:USP8_dimer domain-containing protein n=1 Tax=Panagrellus redivivus TaxID=6233 RepID=A0A7E4WB02_PANRE